MYLFILDSFSSRGYDNWLFGECSKLGIHKGDVSILHLTEIIPAKTGQRPTATQIKEHAPAFYKELSEQTAKVIVPFGPDCARAVLGLKRGIESLRGYCFTRDDLGIVSLRHKEEDGQYKSGKNKGEVKYKNVMVSEAPMLPEGAVVIPTYSVAYILQKRRKPFYVFAQDLRRAKSAAEGTLVMHDGKFNADRSFSTVPVIGWEPLGGRFAFDIECAAIPGGWSREPRSFAGISLSDGVTSMSLDWDEQTRGYVNEYLSSPRYTKYAHNSKFDTARLRDAGAHVVQPIIDTMILGQLLQPDILKRLETQASVYLNLKPWKLASESDPYFYSAKDSFVTMLLANELEARVEQLGMTKLSLQINKTIPLLLDMEERGIRVDTARAKAWAAELENEVASLAAQWVMLTGGDAPSPSSPRALHKYLYDVLGLETQRNTSDGSTVDAEALFNLKKLYPQHAEKLEVLTKYRTVSKQFGTYGKALASLESKGENYVHPQYLPGGQEGETFGSKGGASTGRLGVREPNIQNQTQEARKIYVPDNEGQVFIEFDFAQAELRVIAALSRDENLQRALLPGNDIHQLTADRLQIPRPLAKNILYASCYLGGAKTIQSMMKKHGQLIEIAEIKNAQAHLRAEYPEMFGWQQATIQRGAAQGYLVNPFGRVRFFYGGRDDGPEMADFLPQSTIADITWAVMAAVNRIACADEGRLVTQVHDSFLVLVDKAQVEDSIVSIKGVLEQEFPQIAPGFRIPVSVKIGQPGQSWGELKEGVVNV